MSPVRRILPMAAAAALACSPAAGRPDAGMPRADGGIADAGPDAGLVGGGGDGGPDGGLTDGGGDGGLLPRLASRLVNTRFEVAEHMRASLEMQLSGEPFAQLLGYNLAGFDRTLRVTDQYIDPATGIETTNPLAYALAVESYEYSKQPMNNLSFESGAGLSLQFGPVLNPSGAAGDAGYLLLLDRFQQFAAESFSGGPLGTNLVVSPAPASNPLNYYGWPGLWPVFAEFESFDPTIYPLPGGVNTCTIHGTVGALGYGSGPSPFALVIANYECDYNSLNLPNRDSQVAKILAPDALGYAAWKQGLWSINYWSTLQDSAGNGITWVDAGELPQVGQPGNQVVGYFPSASDPTGQTMVAGSPGVYLGDIRIEGWQGLMMQEEIDNKAEFLLTRLLTADGVTLTAAALAPDAGATGDAGLPNPVDPAVVAADDYGYGSPLLYFPAQVSVTETPQVGPSAQIYANKLFPQPTAFVITDGASRLASLSGLLGGFGEAFAFTDRNNAAVGGSVPFLATYDGDPFPQDDGQADGEATLHDRALGVIKVALVDLDRLHFDPVHQVLVDRTTVSNGQPTLGSTVTTVELAEAIVALRNVFRALNGSLQLYSNDTPDSQGIPGALDGTPLGGAPFGGTLQGHVISLIAAEASFLSQKLVAPSGAVANGYDLSAGAADPSPTDLASEAAAIRGLLDAYLATSNATYRQTAIQIYQDLQARFWMADVQAFRTTAGVDDPMQYTPLRVGLLSGAMRQYYKLVASSPGREAEADGGLQELKRSYKLIVNGWNDRDQSNTIQYPIECAGTGMEMGERALTGELGHPQDDGDRDHDCVQEISYVSLPAALGAELDITRYPDGGFQDGG
ncbi:MAG: hypothetical protein ACYDCL_16535 [Myxococcales bacterium]